MKFSVALIILLITVSSCKKQASGAYYVSESGKVKIEVTATQVTLDPWLVNVNVIVNEKPFYELSGMEVYAASIDEKTVIFDCKNNSCTINIQQMDGTNYPIPLMKLPLE